MEIGDGITVNYNNGEIYSGIISAIEHTNDSSVVWGDNSTLTERTMIRIQNERGSHRSIYLDKCLGVAITPAYTEAKHGTL